MAEAPAAQQVATLPGWARAWIEALEQANRELEAQVAAARALALQDDASGLPNYRAAAAMLERTVRRHARSGQPFALLVVAGDPPASLASDAAADRLLARRAQAIVDSLRPTDYVARGAAADDFLAILPEADAAAARLVADRLTAAVADAFCDTPPAQAVYAGIAVFPDHGATGEALVAHAAAAAARERSLAHSWMAAVYRGT